MTTSETNNVKTMAEHLHSAMYHRSNQRFYYWVAVISILGVLLTSGYLYAHQLVAVPVIYGSLAGASIPIGLIYWRYAVNKNISFNEEQPLRNSGRPGAEGIVSSIKIARQLDAVKALPFQVISMFRHFFILMAGLSAILMFGSSLYALDGQFKPSISLLTLIGGVAFSFILTPFHVLAHRGVLKRMKAAAEAVSIDNDPSEDDVEPPKD